MHGTFDIGMTHQPRDVCGAQTIMSQPIKVIHGHDTRKKAKNLVRLHYIFSGGPPTPSMAATLGRHTAKSIHPVVLLACRRVSSGLQRRP